MVVANDVLDTKKWMKGKKVTNFFELSRSLLIILSDGTSLEMNTSNEGMAISGSFWINDKDKTAKILDKIRITKEQLE